MIKPGSLRDHLTAAVPELVRNPDKLLVFIDGGQVASRLGPGLSFEYRYTLKLIFTDFAAHPDAVVVPLLTWLRMHQPDLLADFTQSDRIAFRADLLDHDKVDLEFTLPLTESVGVHPREGGGYTVEHYPEPQLEPDLAVESLQLYPEGHMTPLGGTDPAA